MVMCGRTGQFQRNMFFRLFLATDDGIEMIDTGYMHLFEMFEYISFTAGMQTQPVLEQQMTGKQDTVFLTPFADLFIIGIGVLFRQRAPEIMSYLCRIFSHRRIEGG